MATIFQVSLQGTNSVSDQWQTSFFVRPDGGAFVGPDGLNFVAQALLETWWDNGMAGFYTPTTIFTRVLYRQIESNTGQSEALSEQNWSKPGTGTGSSLPPDNAFVISLRSTGTSRRQRGRMYLPALRSAVLATDGRVDLGDRDDIVDATGALFDGLATAGAVPIIYSRTGRSFIDVTSIDGGDVMDTQRRRDNAITERRHNYQLS